MRKSLLLVFFFVLKALAQVFRRTPRWDSCYDDISEWVRIDCGSEFRYTDLRGAWQPDEDFIKTGENKVVSPNSLTLLDQFNTLRAFTEQNKNCYSLPTTTSVRYFIRAVFFYGNYDGLSNPPTFDLEFDGNKWATVVTGTSEIAYYEMIYAAIGDITSICLARTHDKQFPFISILESWPVPDKMYANMANDRAWFNGYRYNYGADPDSWILGYPDDTHNRVWEPMTPPGSEAITATFDTLDATTVNDPPVLAIIQAVQAPNPTDKLELSFTFSKTNRLDHVELYFTEPLYATTRSFNINVNNEIGYAISPEYQRCDGVWINVVSVSTLNIELAPINNSAQPPVISAIEVYTASDPFVTAYTSKDDLDGLAPLINNFKQLEGWSGDPCLPNDTIWQWLGCSGDNPPRVTSIYLSGYGLHGPLPDFSQMDALETIDLRNNNLDGPIPEFLGKLPNLRLLDLRDNSFTGGVPQSITNNKQLKYMIGNSDNQSEGKRLALIIGLAVGLPVFLVFVTVLVFLVRKQKTTIQGQVTAVELGGSEGGAATGEPQEGIVSTTMSTEALISPSLAIEQTTSISNGDSFATDSGLSHMHLLPIANEDPGAMSSLEESSMDANVESFYHYPPTMQMIDEDELNDLLRRHGQN